MRTFSIRRFAKRSGRRGARFFLVLRHHRPIANDVAICCSHHKEPVEAGREDYAPIAEEGSAYCLKSSHCREKQPIRAISSTAMGQPHGRTVFILLLQLGETNIPAEFADRLEVAPFDVRQLGLSVEIVEIDDLG